MFLSFDIANITSAPCPPQRGLYRDPRMYSLMPCLQIKSTSLMPLFHVVVRFLPWCCKKVVEGAGTYGGVLEIAHSLLRFLQVLIALVGSRCLWDFFHYWVLHDNAAFFIFSSAYERSFFVVRILFPSAVWQYLPKINKFIIIVFCSTAHPNQNQVDSSRAKKQCSMQYICL